MRRKVQKSDEKAFGNSTSWQDKKISNIDFEREERCGIPEIIFGEKEVEDLKKIIVEILEKKSVAIITRIKKAKKENLTNLLNTKSYIYDEKGKVLIIFRNEEEFKRAKEKERKIFGKVGIITAGTADVNVAEESKTILKFFGCEIIEEHDCGIAGLHRTIKAVEKMKENKVNVILVFAGMEGALPSIISGLIDVPVLGIPTSVGYGTGKKGKSALLTMLNSCTPVAVVNIDNGYSAAIIAYKILREINKARNLINS